MSGFKESRIGYNDSTFPRSVLKAAEKSITCPPDLSRRKCVRGISVDGSKNPEAVDDAIWFEKGEGNDVRVSVHIADATEQVEPGSELDNESYKRVFTRYLRGGNIPMLPSLVTEKLSLKRGAIRPTITASFTVSNSIGDVSIDFTYLKNERQITYSQVSDIVKNPDDPHCEMLRTAVKVTGGLKGERVSKGGKSFLKENFPEYFIRYLDWKREGKGIDVVQEAMIQDGRISADHFARSGFSSIYRIHEGIAGKKARYSSEAQPHMGLMLPAYSHATSPIRRRADVDVQLLLKAEWLGISPPYSSKDLSERADYYSDSYLQFIKKVELDQRIFSEKLEKEINSSRITNKFFQEAKERLVLGDVRKEDVTQVLARQNGHDSRLAILQELSLDWFIHRAHFANDLFNALRQDRKLSYPWYDKNKELKEGATVAVIRTETGRSIHSTPFEINGDREAARNAALLDALFVILNTHKKPKENVVFEA